MPSSGSPWAPPGLPGLLWSLTGSGGAGGGGTCSCWGTSARSPCTRGPARCPRCPGPRAARPPPGHTRTSCGAAGPAWTGRARHTAHSGMWAPLQERGVGGGWGLRGACPPPRCPRSLLPRHPGPGREDHRDPVSTCEKPGGAPGPLLEKAPLGSREGGRAKCLVYESGEERRQSSNACHKLLSSRSNELKGGAAIITLTRQHPDPVPSYTVSPELSVSWGRGPPAHPSSSPAAA